MVSHDQGDASPISTWIVLCHGVIRCHLCSEFLDLALYESFGTLTAGRPLPQFSQMIFKLSVIRTSFSYSIVFLLYIYIIVWNHGTLFLLKILIRLNYFMGERGLNSAKMFTLCSPRAFLSDDWRTKNWQSIYQFYST